MNGTRGAYGPAPTLLPGPRSPVRRITILILSGLVLAAAPSGSPASEFRIEPSVTVSEEYNDNVTLHPVDTVNVMITRIIPSVHLVYKAPLWDWDITYSYEYRYYYVLDDYRETMSADYTQRLNLFSTTRIIEDFFLFDVKDEYSSVSLFSSQNFADLSVTANQTEQNTLTLNPYLVFRPTDRMKLIAGYEYRNIWYEDAMAIDKSVHATYGDLSQELTERLEMTASARYETTDSTQRDFTHTTFLVGPRYEYREKSMVWCRVGMSTFGGDAGGEGRMPIWDAGIRHVMANNVLLTYETGRTWIDDPLLILRREDYYIASLNREREIERTKFNLSLAYREYGTAGFSDERKYSTSVSFSHYLTQKLQGLYAFTIDRYERFPVASQDSMTIVYLTDVRFVHHASESLTYSLIYRYADSYARYPFIDNYENNRIIAEITKRF